MFLLIWHTLVELTPWLLIGVAVAGALHALLPSDFMRRHLSGRWSVLKAAAIGVPLPLCSCSVIPVGLSLKKQGATSGASIAFLISTPQTGVDSIMVSAGLLGLPFALFKMVSAFVIGVVGGVLTDTFTPPAKNAAMAPATSCQVRRESRLRTALAHSVMLLRTIWRWLVVGVVASAAISYFVPAESLGRLGVHGGVWAMLLAVLIGMPLYVCAVASVPIAAALVHGGFPPGAALAFLIAGPASNIATMGAVYQSLGRRAFGIYMATVAIGSIACGWAFEPLINFGAFHTVAHAHEGHSTDSPWAVGSAVLLLALMAWFCIQEALEATKRRKNRNAIGQTSGLTILADHPRPAAEMPFEANLEVPVSGMTCENCASRLESVLKRDPEVSSASVSLRPGRATVSGRITAARLRELIERAGFQSAQP